MWLTREEMPKTVITDSGEYEIVTDFRAWINFESIMTDANILDGYKLYFMINSVMEMPPKVGNELLEALFSFYRLGKPIRAGTPKNTCVAYRFDYDMDLIFAAFKQQYGISLLDADMHWWEFKSLFDGLTDKTKFIQVVGYRTADLSKMDNEQKQRYTELKKFYALPVEKAQERTQKEIEAEILSALKGGDGIVK